MSKKIDDLPILGLSIWKKRKRYFIETEHMGSDGTYPCKQTSYPAIPPMIKELRRLLARDDWVVD